MNVLIYILSITNAILLILVARNLYTQKKQSKELQQIFNSEKIFENYIKLWREEKQK